MRLGAVLRGCWSAALVSALLPAMQGAAGAERWCGGEWRPVVGARVVEGEHYTRANERLYGAWTLWQGGWHDDCDVQVEFRIEPVGAGVRAAGILFRGVDDGRFFYAHFDTGNVHRLGARRDGDEWVMLLDGSDQIRVPASLGKPCGFLARPAAVALTEVGWLDASAQMVEDALEVKVGSEETR